MKKFFIIFFFPIFVFAQQIEYKFFITFSDKNNSDYTIDNPEDFLSQRSIDRRLSQNIDVKFSDLPVNKNYILSVKSEGFKVLNQTKWMNGIIVSTIDSSLISNLNFLFIDTIIYFGSWEIKNKYHRERFSWNRESNYGSSLNQIYMIWGDSLHYKGFQGQGKIIAVLDAGFYNVDSLLCFSHLFETGRILGTYDFVEKEQEVFNDDTHGMSVLSTMAANLDGEIIGTAPFASYYLLRTEDAFSETLIEEYNWICGAEFADSVGADIINSSLGYSNFDNSIQSYSYEDLDGKTAISTIAATIASRKGIVVVNSAGNEGNDNWKYIVAPADADSILSVGAVNQNKQIAGFSSYGPTSDGRTKPSVCAQGQNTTVISSSGDIISSNGTSFSSPVLAGMVACLWQAHSTKNNMEIINAIIHSASLYNNPNDHEGYGLANFYKADSILRLTEDFTPSLNLFPNPTNNTFNIELYAGDNYKVEISIYDIAGNLVHNEIRNVNSFCNNVIIIPSLGISKSYLVNVRLKEGNLSQKIIFTD